MIHQVFLRLSNERSKYARLGDPGLAYETFEKVRAIADNSKINTLSIPANANEVVVVRCDLHHPALPEIFRLVRADGWAPSPESLSCVDSAERTRRRLFEVKVFRHYDEADLDACELLQVVHDWRDSLTSIELAADGRPVGATEYVGRDSEEGWGQRIGYVGQTAYVVHPSVRESLDGLQLAGMDYVPLLWDKPEEAEHDYWVLRPSVVMPRCQTPNLAFGRSSIEFDESPYSPAELRYSRADVAELGAFDIARTLEVSTSIANRPTTTELEKHLLVVSQRFRRASLDLGLNLDFIPVRLDAPPPELPWFFTADSPPATA